MSRQPPAVGKKPQALRSEPVAVKSDTPIPLPKPAKKPAPIPTPPSQKDAKPAKPIVAAKPRHLSGNSRDQLTVPLMTTPPEPVSPKQEIPVIMGPPATPKRMFLKPKPPPSREPSRERRRISSDDISQDLRARDPCTTPFRSPSHSPAPPPPRSRDVSRSRDSSVGPKPLLTSDASLKGPLLAPHALIMPRNEDSGSSVHREGAIPPCAAPTAAPLQPSPPVREPSVAPRESGTAPRESSAAPREKSVAPRDIGPRDIGPRETETMSRDNAPVPNGEAFHDKTFPAPHRETSVVTTSIPVDKTSSPPIHLPPRRDSSYAVTEPRLLASGEPKTKLPQVRKPLPDPTSFVAPPVHHVVAAKREEQRREASGERPPLPRRRETSACTSLDSQNVDFLPPPRRSSTQSSSISEAPRLIQSVTSADVPVSKSNNDRNEAPPPTRQATFCSINTGESIGEQNSSPSIDGYQDYPDSSKINRKPPTHTRLAQLSLKHEIKCMDSNKDYMIACSTGHTFVVSTESLELLFSEVHNELKVSAVKVINNDHAIIGFKEGDLWDIDLKGGIVGVRRSTYHSAPIVMIHKSPNGLYTLSEDGKICTWPKDEDSPLSGTPKQLKLATSLIRFAVGVEDTIWVGKSRNAFIYNESMNFVNPLVVSCAVPGNRPCLDISCISYSDGHVYFGHENGNITVFSSASTKVVAQKFVCPSCPHAILAKEGLIWVGFKNGQIRILNANESQWKIMKSFEAHQSGVSGISGGPRVITSFGNSTYLRFWDALLLEYWEDENLSQREEEYCEYQSLSVTVITWNCGAISPSRMQRARKEDKLWIERALDNTGYPDVVVFGFQELVELTDKGLSAKALLGLHKKDDISGQYQLWEDEMCYLLGHEYRCIQSHYLVGLFSVVFVRKDLSVSGVSCAEVKTGLGGLHGNKGAVCIRFTVADSSLCFVNVHLAAGQSQVANRVKDLESCFNKEVFKKDASREEFSKTSSSSSSSRVYIHGGDGSLLDDYENLFFLGDMNFRVNQHPKLAIQHVNNNRLEKLLQSDQLSIQMKKNISFPLRSFVEPKITFPPTYKFDVGTDTYDSSEKKRVPSWCDRILYRGPVSCLKYDSPVVRLSDHRPVVGHFDVRIKSINENKYDRVRMEIRQSLKGI